MIYRSLAEVPPDFGPCAITIGNFDGVHKGHRQIMQRVRALAREHGWKSAVLTFDPHPSKLVAPDRAPRLLTTPEQRVRLILEQGIDEVLILPFTSEIAKLTPEEFVREILADKLKARAVLVGDNFRFGHRAAGDAEKMEELGDKYSFSTEIVGAISWRGRVISSSEIRRQIEAGNVSFACRLLGRPYALQGRGGPRRRQRIETNGADPEPGYPGRGAAEDRRLRDAHARVPWPAGLAFHHQHRLPSHIQWSRAHHRNIFVIQLRRSATRRDFGGVPPLDSRGTQVRKRRGAQSPDPSRCGTRPGILPAPGRNDRTGALKLNERESRKER